MQNIKKVVVIIGLAAPMLLAGCGTTDGGGTPHTHSLQHIGAVASTCTQKGHEEYWQCTGCNEIFGDEQGIEAKMLSDLETAALGHHMTKHAAKDATCTEAGNLEYYVCSHEEGVYYKDEDGTEKFADLAATVVEANGHDLTHHEAVAATCTEKGHTEYWQCETCNKVYEDAAGTQQTDLYDVEIPKAQHTLVPVEAKAATCTEGGVKEGFVKCSECGKYFFENMTTLEADYYTEIKIAATGHDMNHVPAKAATCTEAGNEEYWHCSVCDKYYWDANGGMEAVTGLTELTINATGHQNITHHKAKAETCTQGGNIEYWTCDDCGAYFSDSEGQTTINQSTVQISKHAHSLTKVEKTETCTETGTWACWHCSECDLYYDNQNGNGTGYILEHFEIPATGHDMVHHAAKAATCTEAGNLEYWTCNNESDVYYKDVNGSEKFESEAATVIAATGHNPTHVDAVIETCTEAGVIEHYHCSDCGKDFAEEACTTELTSLVGDPATGHDMSASWDNDGTNHWHTCLNNDCTYIEDTEAHNYIVNSDDTNHWEECSVCGYVDSSTEEKHSLAFNRMDTEPSADVDGIAIYKCSECGKEVERNIGTVSPISIETTVGTNWSYVSKEDFIKTYYGVAVTNIKQEGAGQYVGFRNYMYNGWNNSQTGLTATYNIGEANAKFVNKFTYTEYVYNNIAPIDVEIKGIDLDDNEVNISSYSIPTGTVYDSPKTKSVFFNHSIIKKLVIYTKSFSAGKSGDSNLFIKEATLSYEKTDFETGNVAVSTTDGTNWSAVSKDTTIKAEYGVKGDRSAGGDYMCLRNYFYTGWNESQTGLTATYTIPEADIKSVNTLAFTLYMYNPSCDCNCTIKVVDVFGNEQTICNKAYNQSSATNESFSFDKCPVAKIVITTKAFVSNKVGESNMLFKQFSLSFVN